MSYLDLRDINKIMRHIDICMMATLDRSGGIQTRPMSNNREVDFNGCSYFFADGTSTLCEELRHDPHVTLSYSGTHSLLNRTDVYISVNGKADLIVDKEIMRKHWVKDLEIYFEDGIDTQGLTMIEVVGRKVRYWDGSEQGELILPQTL